MCATTAGTPSFSDRLKSTSRYARLCPPPWCRAVTRPCTFRPPLECSGRTSDFSGVLLVISEKSATEAPRRPGVVGLYLRIPIGSSRPYPCSGAAEDVDRLAVTGQRDDGPLGGLAPAVAGAGALALALPVDRVHRDDLDTVEDLLDGDLDLRLVDVRPHLEGVAAGLQQAVAFLGDDRPKDDVAGIGDHFSSSCSSSASAASIATAATVDSSAAACRPPPAAVTSTVLPEAARNSSSAARVNTTSSLSSTS